MEDLKPCRSYGYKRVSPGCVVGRLTVLHISGKSKNGSNIWKCLCKCGGTIDVISSSLNSGLTQSCGCLYDEIKGKQRLTHGKSNDPTYNSWLAMKQRCYYSKHEYFSLYGGRGIKVCDRWINSFENFLEDMGEKPENLTLDRKDVNGDYCKENCRWVSNSLQGYNTNKHSNNTSGRTGVSFHKASGKWQASLGFENKSIYLGLFETYEEAVDCREKAEIKYFGFIKE